ncbi:MAG: alpha/beta fold hydrolase, partial [Planctomycetes bacterium]|nr:alpha/beta fold hydrolase [Planctomycetota bacterium]
QAHYIDMPPGLFLAEHPHATESIIYCVRGQFVLCSGGRRQLMKPGSLMWFKANEPTGWEVPFNEPAYILIFKGSRSEKSDDEFLDYLRGLAEKLNKEQADGTPYHFRDLPADHPAREFARKVNPDFEAKLPLVSAINPQPDPNPQAIRPFTIRVGDAVLAELRERLARTRWPDTIEGSGWEYGVDLAYLKELVDYWRTKYDWREQERRLNQFPQFVTEIDGIDLHFLHVRSKEPGALPLAIIHGWPGSFVEFTKIIGPLTDPVAHGGKPEDAFHVICPSLPGFGFSGKPREPGWSSQRMAEMIAKLMARLGYERYGAQGGDWGAGVTRWLAANDGGHCVGGHSNFPPASQPPDDPMRGVTPQELERIQQRVRELNDHKAYGAIQGTRPLTLGYGLNDSPAGLAAWVVDKFWAWSDHGGNLENSFTKDELLTNVMIYWVTGTMPSSVRIYYESSHNNPRPSSMTPFASSGKPAPMGFALFPKEINVPPRAWVERNMEGSLVHWTEMPRGGHFAAMEQPELLIEDVRKFFRPLRDSSER